jgi:hypothetical protein
MNKIKKSINAFLGILFIGLVGAVVTTNAQNPATTSKDVNVVNTPTVTLAPGSTVGIASTNNTVKVDSSTPVTVQSDKAVLIYDQTFQFPAGSPPPQFSAPINISAYSRIRVIASIVAPSAETVTVFTRVHFDDEGQPGPSFNFDELLSFDSSEASELYELPGFWMSFFVNPNDFAFQRNVRIQAYGKK